MDYKNLYASAHGFLLAQIPAENPQSVLDHYLLAPESGMDPKSINEVYFRLLASAQNANMKAGVIGGSIGGIENLGKALFDFDPGKVLDEFGGDTVKLLDHIKVVLNPKGKIRIEAKSLWPKYCITVLSAATFLRQFKDGKDFYRWANHFYGDDRSMLALPWLLSQEIYGLGYPLACDFMKDMGFVKYGKPDVHIRRIFLGFGLIEKQASDYQVQRMIARIAAEVEVTPYNVDKLFWLIGSGKFYDHKHLGSGGLIGRMGDRFVSEFAEN